MPNRDLKRILGLEQKEIEKQNLDALTDFWVTAKYLGYNESDIIKLLSQQCKNTSPEEIGRIADVLLNRAIELYREKGLSDLQTAQTINNKNYQKNECFGKALFTGEDVRRGLVLYQNLIKEELQARVSLVDVVNKEEFDSLVEHNDGAVHLTSRLRGLHTVYHKMIRPTQKYTYDDVMKFSHMCPFDVSRLDAALMELTLDDMQLPQVVKNQEKEQNTLVTLANGWLAKMFSARREVISAPIYGFVESVQVAAEHQRVVAQEHYEHTVAWVTKCLEYAKNTKRRIEVNYQLQKQLLAYAANPKP
jgi:hypothetical protein